MAITTNAICNSFKKQLMGGEHDFDSGGDTFNLAMLLLLQQSVHQLLTIHQLLKYLHQRVTLQVVKL